MILIDKEKCTGCGFCIKDCFVNNISITDGKAAAIRENCFLCGHCIAVCPQNAVTITDYPDCAAKEDGFDLETARIEPEALLRFIKANRSVRQFQDKMVEKEKIEMLIEAGRFTPTGGNRQNVSYVVVQDKLPQVLDMAIERLKELGEAFLSDEKTLPHLKSYAKRWIGMYHKYKENPDEPTILFFKAKTVILVASEMPVDGHLAAASMKWMAHAQGLGMLFSGFFVRAANGNQKMKEFLGIDDSKEVVSCMLVGYPDVKYLRSVPRKKADVKYV